MRAAYRTRRSGNRRPPNARIRTASLDTSIHLANCGKSRESTIVPVACRAIAPAEWGGKKRPACEKRLQGNWIGRANHIKQVITFRAQAGGRPTQSGQIAIEKMVSPKISQVAISFPTL